ncbi:hypothetical protein [Lentibacillus sp. Marseille-P4043]|uniref:hypothetical protein n=1 Tax=Lentibacillus sp. Marseille-P4043 TaxID=2040293 RepID=UPI000D0ADC13|nr:hypothetical protein [Lentibacillus sp. Marseille-P4043]
MSLWFYVTIIVGFSLIYYGYDKKKSYEFKIAEIELEQKRLDLEMKKIECGVTEERQDESD